MNELERSAPPPPALNRTLPYPPLTLNVCHPGYTPLTPILSFCAYDVVPNTGIRGVSHALVRDACYIVANNKPGYLSRDASGTTRVGEEETILPATEPYYYFVDETSNTNIPYPVIFHFEDWTYPHTLPPQWTAPRPQWVPELNNPTAMSEAVKRYDTCCVVTRFEHAGACGNAHLVPKDQVAWFLANKMRLYNSNSIIAGTDDVRNGIRLRADVHRCFDRSDFVAYPLNRDGNFVAYFLRLEPDYAELYHRTRMSIHPRVSKEFLYARFAWSIINNTHRIDINTVPPSAAVKTMSEHLAQEKKARSVRQRVSVTPTEDSIPEEEKGARMEDIPAEDANLRVSDIDEDEFFEIFPHLRTPREHSNDRHYNEIQCYPGMKRTAELKAKYVRENPNVWQTSTSEENSAKRPDTTQADKAESNTSGSPATLVDAGETLEIVSYQGRSDDVAVQ